MKKQLIALLSILSVAMPMTGLAQDPAPITTTILVDTNTTWAGNLIEYLKAKDPQVRIQTSEFLPGVATDWHTHEIPAYIFVQSGTFRVELLDGRMQQWNAGQAFVEVVNTVHRGVNPGTENAKLVIVFTGETGTPFLTPYPPSDDKDKDKKDKDKKFKAE